MKKELIEDGKRETLYRNVERAVNILDSVRASLVDALGENAEDITDALHYTIERLNLEILEGIGNLPTK